MVDMFQFFLEIGYHLFDFLGNAELYQGTSLLSFLVSFIILLIVVDNFIIKARKGSSSSGGKGKSKSTGMKSKQGAGDSK